MKYYTLENKAMDHDFLRGIPVVCKVTLHPTEVARGHVNTGDTILVVLSNRAKYKGRIVKFEYVRIDGYAIGEMEVVRAARGD